MSLILQSSGGGSITIAEPTTASNFTLDLPASTGTVLTTTSPKVGNVIQVVQNVVVVNNSTTSSSFVTSGVSVSITPISASSKILIISTGVGYNGNNSSQSDYTLYRNSTNLAAVMMAQIYTSGGSFEGSVAMHFLDSPATTSSTTYAVYYRAASGTAYYGFDKTATITAMEIAA